MNRKFFMWILLGATLGMYGCRQADEKWLNGEIHEMDTSDAVDKDVIAKHVPLEGEYAGMIAVYDSLLVHTAQGRTLQGCQGTVFILQYNRVLCIYPGFELHTGRHNVFYFFSKHHNGKCQRIDSKVQQRASCKSRVSNAPDVRKITPEICGNHSHFTDLSAGYDPLHNRSSRKI